MTLPVRARVRAVPHFLTCLEAARAFMMQQDADSAKARFERLQAALSKARRLLHFEPASGRPARFLEASTAWGRFQAEEARQLAASLGTPGLRELVLAHHVLLYAHAERDVVLLSLRHERQLAFTLPRSGQA